MKYLLNLLCLIILVGIFLIPSKVFACAKKSEKSCCKTEVNIKNVQSCCSSKIDKEQKNSCGGKCGQSNCTSISTSFQSVLNLFYIAFSKSEILVLTQKPIFFYSQSLLSPGFIVVWSPPNIK